MSEKRKDKSIVYSSAAEYLTYVAATGGSDESIELRYEDENIWLTQKMMAALYGVEINTINEHIKKIYRDDELQEDATIRKFRIVQTEGNRQVAREVIHYNLQMIIAVGFKVNNERAVRFRKWANGIVKNYTIKGWVIDDERLKNGGSVLTKEYFDRLKEKYPLYPAAKQAEELRQKLAALLKTGNNRALSGELSAALDAAVPAAGKFDPRGKIEEYIAATESNGFNLEEVLNPGELKLEDLCKELGLIEEKE